MIAATGSIQITRHPGKPDTYEWTGGDVVAISIQLAHELWGGSMPMGAEFAIGPYRLRSLGTNDYQMFAERITDAAAVPDLVAARLDRIIALLEQLVRQTAPVSVSQERQRVWREREHA